MSRIEQVLTWLMFLLSLPGLICFWWHGIVGLSLLYTSVGFVLTSLPIVVLVLVNKHCEETHEVCEVPEETQTQAETGITAHAA